MNTANGSAASSDANVRKSMQALARDAIELGELQVQLLKLDASESARGLRGGIVLLAIAVVALFAALPIVLLAVTEALVVHLELSRILALSISGGGALLLGGLLLLAAWGYFRHALTTWGRSTEELNRNMDWLKSALQADSSSQSAVRKPTEKTHNPSRSPQYG